MDFEEGAVIVAECSYEGHASAPKTRASRRKVFVDTPAIEALSRARPTDANPESLVFCTDRGTAFNPNNVRNRVLVSACQRAKIPQVSWHNFRYTYSTWANPWREHQGITSAVGAYGFATHAFGVHTTNAGSSEAAGV